MKPSKPFSKKEKAAALIVSATLLSAPFLFDPMNTNYAQADSSSMPSENPIQHLVVPLNGSTEIRNLKKMYGNSYNGFEIISSNPNVAYNEPGYGRAGLLKIHPNQIGTTTFTVSYDLYEDPQEFTFDVTVVNDNSLTAERNFDIQDIAKLATSRPDAESLLSKITPMNTTGNMPGNTPPVYTPPVGNDPIHNFTVEVGTENYSLGNLSSLFSDDDIFTVSVFENQEYSPNPAVAIHQQYYGSGSWYIYPRHEGISTFTLAAMDKDGGVSTKTFQVTVNARTGDNAPTIRTDTPLANFLTQAVHELNISNDSGLNLNDLFYDDTSYLEYELEVSYTNQNSAAQNLFLYSDSYVTNNSIGWSLDVADTDFTITKVHAYDLGGHKSTLNNANIKLSKTDLISSMPESFNLYGNNNAGTGEFLVDPSKYWLESGMTLVDIQDADPDNQTVTGSVYEGNKLKFLANFNSLESEISSSSFHIYSMTSPTQWYLNEVRAYPLSADYNYIINLNSLYSNNAEIGISWTNIHDLFYDYVTISPTNVSVLGNVYGWNTSSDLIIYPEDLINDENAGDGIVLTIDPDAGTPYAGTRVYRIPYVKQQFN